MDILVFLAVIFAAFLHAAWNAVLKSGDDKLASVGSIIIGQIPPAVLVIAISPSPDLASLPYLAAGIAIHFFYQIFLAQSYKIGDLTQVYPIARGSGPLIVTAVSVLFLGVALAPGEAIGIALICLGILSLTLARQSDGLRNRKATYFALATGALIAGYSLVDGLGARVAGTALGFYGWLALGNGLLMAGYLRVRSPASLEMIARSQKTLALVGGSASFAAFAIVTWAFTQAPIALVAALRETSIVFAMLIGAFFLKEKLDLHKMVAILLTVAGVLALKVLA